MRKIFILCAGIVGLSVSGAYGDLRCAYLSDEGEVEQVDSIEKAPPRFRSRIVCAGGDSGIPSPEDVELDGTVRTASFVTDLGPIDVKWPLSVERCFGRSPARAVADAATTVNKALASARFPPEVKNGSRKWTLAFTDRAAALKQFPAALTIGGHPGFMLPPNQIYLIADFISPTCDQTGVADAVLTQVLLHEMGHVIEFLILGNEFGLDRPRAEGFASWFEQYSADFSRAIPKESVRKYYRKLAAEALKTLPAPFDGTPYDYARAALKFDAIVSKRGVIGLMDIYSVMKRDHILFDQAVEKSLKWSQKFLDREMAELVVGY